MTAPPRHLLWVFPGFGVGGAQMRFVDLARALGPAWRHSIVALNNDLACRDRLDPAVAADFPPAGHRRGAMAPAVLRARAALVRARPDLVITSNWGAIEWAIGARLAGLAHVHTEDGFGPEERTAQIRRRVLTRRLVLRGSTVVLPSRTLLRIATDAWRLPAARLRLIPNGIDLARFAAAPPMLLPAGAGPVIGTVAALRPEKNLGRLLRAFAALRARRPARLVIVGDGPERPGLERLAAVLGVADAVLFAGHTDAAERWLAAFDVFALSSDTEQMPLGVLEAMAAGLPVLGTDVGDVAAMVAPANAGFIVAATDAAFTDGLARLLEADLTTTGATIGAANRQRAQAEYGQPRMVAAWARVLGPVTAD